MRSDHDDDREAQLLTELVKAVLQRDEEALLTLVNSAMGATIGLWMP